MSSLSSLSGGGGFTGGAATSGNSSSGAIGINIQGITTGSASNGSASSTGVPSYVWMAAVALMVLVAVRMLKR